MELRVGNKYRLGRKIGSGSFGDIYLGKCKHFIFLFLFFSCLTQLSACSLCYGSFHISFSSSSLSFRTVPFNFFTYLGTELDFPSSSSITVLVNCYLSYCFCASPQVPTLPPVRRSPLSWNVWRPNTRSCTLKASSTRWCKEEVRSEYIFDIFGNIIDGNSLLSLLKRFQEFDWIWLEFIFESM